MASLVAFFEREKLAMLAEDYQRAADELDCFREQILCDPPVFDLTVCVHFTVNEEVFSLSVQMRKNRTAGQLKALLVEKYDLLSNFKLTIICGSRIAKDFDTLESLQVDCPGMTVYCLASEGEIEDASFDLPIEPESIPRVLAIIEEIEMTVKNHQLEAFSKIISGYVDKIRGLDELNFKFAVEDVHKQYGELRVDVPRDTTIGGLKSKVADLYQLPEKLQRWVIRSRMRQDDECLETFYPVNRGSEATGAVLYIVTPETAGITAAQLSAMYDALKEKLLAKSELADARRTHNNAPMNEEEVIYLGPDPEVGAAPGIAGVGWRCDTCSVTTNRPYFRICEVCGEGERPLDFEIPDWYQPDDEETAKIEAERIQREQTEEFLRQEEERANYFDINAYQALMDAEEGTGTIANSEQFECTICMEDIAPTQGITLRECHHSICRECARNAVLAADSININCPLNDEQTGANCEQMLSQHEIRDLLTEGEFDRLIDLSESSAEAAAANSFHCKTADCRGWCIVEDDANFFNCPRCNIQNCLTCNAQHHPKNCKEYQDDLRINAQNDEAAKKTKEMLEAMVAANEAMYCPGCKVIVQKKSGCDWIQCSMCRMEICWATRGARWGPRGKGDTSGGCKCRANGGPTCTPNCGNCH